MKSSDSVDWQTRNSYYTGHGCEKQLEDGVDVVDHPIDNLRIEEKEAKEDPRTAHYARCEAAYWNYVREHEDEFKKGDYVSVVDGEKRPRKYNNYQTMAEETRQLAQGRPWWFTNYGEEDGIINTYLSVIGKFEGYKYGKLAYVETEIESLPPLPGILSPNPGPSVKKAVKMMIDTGASTICIPKSLTKGMNAEFLRKGNSRTGNGPTSVNFIGMKIKLGELEVRQVETIEMENLEECLLGQSFLMLCKHTWIGNHNMEIRYLRADEDIKEVEMKEEEVKIELNVVRSQVSQIQKELAEQQVANEKLKARYDKLRGAYERLKVGK